ncbi:hypothetical protein UFOVP312_47 [uncultured Caudovirales phage]|uniref:Uncharacterized protein n=1 Tax=uncultured Caudovirales phage TaxID=2100421 RepID=A0A6J5LUI7_9CAUD|nr:hypothetical protein UFOVP312_47 [uncultured Caudovirales phage]
MEGDYNLMPDDVSSSPGIVLKRARAKTSASGTLSNNVAAPQSVLPNTRQRLSKIYGELDKLDTQDVDTTSLQAFARQQSERGQGAMLNALAAQFAGESFDPIQAQYMKRAAAASEPMKVGGGILTPEGEFIKDPFAARDSRRTALERQALGMEKMVTEEQENERRREERQRTQDSLEDYRNSSLASLDAYRTAMLANRDNNGTQDARTWRAEDTLRGDFDKLTKDLRDELAATSKITQIVSATPPGQKPDAITQQSLVILLNKFLDPGSVVREGEFDRVVKAQGLEGRVMNLRDRILKGMPLDAATIAQINGLAQLYSNAATSKIQKHATDYTAIAQRRRLNPESVISDPRFRGAGPASGGNVVDFNNLPK